jgi:hypothetical protein
LGKVNKKLGHHGLADESKGDRVVARVKKALEPQWCPAGLTKTQKLCKKKIKEEKREEAHDEWFNKARPMTWTK